ncbi:Uncharacterized protein APZ42_032996 [Daphnia magna]|uniref:Uncharacterized protein n=1 Tax=Daphnia magna TaxID=35525 RepID=A0A162D8D0_9CRUS|nr:Uncharacterized protein APZ42_032996 [Daphnia magna]
MYNDTMFSSLPVLLRSSITEIAVASFVTSWGSVMGVCCRDLWASIATPSPVLSGLFFLIVK